MKVLVTGSAGLIGASIVQHFASEGHTVVGLDNNQRRAFFGPGGDTAPTTKALRRRHPGFRHVAMDVRDRTAVDQLVDDVVPDLIVHAAAQPSHDLAARMPAVDFEINATGTLNLLEAFRLRAPGAAFVFMSTNKVYGDAPNELPFVEQETRYDYARPEDFEGIAETLRIDASTHSLFGVSKAAADLLVQEYGRYFGLATVCLRAGCLTGAFHAGVPLHGFLSYLVRCAVQDEPYTIIGYKGKQVRDNLHGSDVARFCELFAASPRSAAVYNLGGGRGNSCSILEACAAVEARTGRVMRLVHDPTQRVGDHQCYISDTARLRADYSAWRVEVALDEIFDELVESWRTRLEG